MTLGNSTTGTAPFAGVMDDVRIYNYALGDAEVLAIYGSMTGIVRPDEFLPTDFALSQNYPNPFNPSTIIEYELPRSTNIQLTIYDMLGRQVIQLVNEHQPAGRYNISWDGMNESGNSVAAGLYFCRMEANGFSDVIKLALVK